MITINHSGNCGDILYSLPAMRQAHRNTGEDVHVYLVVNQRASYAADIDHPMGMVMMTQKAAEMLKPLLLSTDFIREVTITDTKPQCDYDFDKFRTIGHPYSGHISRWYFYTYPELTCNLSEPIFIPKDPTKQYDIVINRTNRYHGAGWDYLVFRQWQHRMTFVGLPEEYQVLKAKLPQMQYAPVEDFLELAQIITASNVFVGNQSMAFAIAEITKHPRALEICPRANNVIPTGANGYDCFTMFNLKSILSSKFEYAETKAD